MASSRTDRKLDEAARLAALMAYGVLDTPPEAEFDDIVLLARIFCGTPMALVSLVGADRQWFKARAGIELTETPINQSVCAHAIKEREILVIPDLTLDPRTRTIRWSPARRTCASTPARCCARRGARRSARCA